MAAGPKAHQLAALLVIAGCDAALHVLHPGFLGTAALDEPAHVATAVVVLVAIGRSDSVFLRSALVASVAIDVDHLPAQLGTQAFTAGTPRPYTHSLLGVIAIAAVAAVAVRRADVGAGVLVGLLAHLARDVATASGIAALWPFTDAPARIPYAPYFAAVAGVAALATARNLLRRPAAQH